MLKKEIEINLLDLAHNLWEKRYSIIKWAILGLVIGIVIAFSIPKEYKVSADVVPENISSASNSRLSSLAALTGVSAQDNIDGISYKIYPQIITQPTFVMELANVEVESSGRKMTFLEYSLDEQKLAWWIHIITSPIKVITWVSELFSEEQPEVNHQIVEIQHLTTRQQVFLLALQKKLSASLDKETGILQVGLQSQDPNICKQMLDTVLVNLQTYITEYKTNKTRADYEVTKKIMNEARDNFFKYDSIYAETIDKNINLSNASASLKVQRAAESRSIAFNSYQQVVQKLESLNLKIQEQSAIITVLTPPITPLSAMSPNKPLIIISFMFIFGFGYSLIHILKYIIKS